MARTKQSKGKCAYCGNEATKGLMLKHLSTCAERQKAISKSEHRSDLKQYLYHLRVEDACVGDYWLDLEMCGLASLKDLDKYLRAIWLECCGHMSKFTTGGWGSRELGMKTPADHIFEPGVELVHLYDFGTTSETLIKVMGMRGGKKTTSHPIALMARNLPPEIKCIECKKPAAWLCLECMYEDDAPGFLCDKHVQSHPHDEYGEPLPLVNSPRTGMCGYTGPAEPPY